jgi:hypothetical protein
MTPEERIKELSLVLPETVKVPPGLRIPFVWVRTQENRAFVSGHIALNPDGSIYEVRGKVGREVSIEEGYKAARLTGLAILSSLRQELGARLAADH